MSIKTPYCCMLFMLRKTNQQNKTIYPCTFYPFTTSGKHCKSFIIINSWFHHQWGVLAVWVQILQRIIFKTLLSPTTCFGKITGLPIIQFTHLPGRQIVWHQNWSLNLTSPPVAEYLEKAKLFCKICRIKKDQNSSHK